jgi:hypothetical protein
MTNSILSQLVKVVIIKGTKSKKGVIELPFILIYFTIFSNSTSKIKSLFGGMAPG